MWKEDRKLGKEEKGKSFLKTLFFVTPPGNRWNTTQEHNILPLTPFLSSEYSFAFR